MGNTKLLGGAKIIKARGRGIIMHPNNQISEVYILIITIQEKYYYYYYLLPRLSHHDPHSNDEN